MWRKVAVLVVGIVLAITLGTAPAASHHAGCYVNGHDDWYTDNFEYELYPIAWINWGAWDSTGDYIAGRYTDYPTHNKTFHEWRPGGEGIFWAVSSSGDNVYRFSTQQRAGYGWRQFGLSTYRHC